MIEVNSFYIFFFERAWDISLRRKEKRKQYMLQTNLLCFNNKKAIVAMRCVFCNLAGDLKQFKCLFHSLLKDINTSGSLHPLSYFWPSKPLENIVIILYLKYHIGGGVSLYY